ncbi:hypothetical protein [Lentzea sp. NPDC060358]|uniref:hypothetical protein n=1 Tax=Lentzea sp. NPDC060358 TaxID=3347103 RepID=UPI003660D12A
MAVIASWVIAVAGTGTPAIAAPAPGLCAMDEARGVVPADYPIEACTTVSEVILRNTLALPVQIKLTGDAPAVQSVDVNQGLAAVLTRLRHSDPSILMPGDVARVPLGRGGSTISVDLSRAGRNFALLTTLVTFMPGLQLADVKKYWGIYTTLITEISDVYADYENCVADTNWVERLKCDVLRVRNVEFAVGRAVASGLSKKLFSLFLSLPTFLKWADAQPKDAGKIIHGTRTLTVAARTTSEPPVVTTEVMKPAAPALTNFSVQSVGVGVAAVTFDVGWTAGTDPVRCVIYVDDSAVQESQCGTRSSTRVTGLAAGVHRFKALVRDRLGNTSQWSPTLAVDIPGDGDSVPPPPVAPVEPKPTVANFVVVVKGGGNVGVAFDVGWQSGRDPVICHFLIDGQIWFEAQCGTHSSKQFNGVSPGQHVFDAQVSDRFGVYSDPVPSIVRTTT